LWRHHSAKTAARIRQFVPVEQVQIRPAARRTAHRADCRSFPNFRRLRCLRRFAAVQHGLATIVVSLAARGLLWDGWRLARRERASDVAGSIWFHEYPRPVLAGNIANVNTPGYRLRDLSQTAFQEKLKEAIHLAKESGRPLSPGVVHSEAGDPMRGVRESLENILYHDDTNIYLEKQVSEITKNQLLHNFALTVMTDQFGLLQQAISERV
jgi:flagellar basal-body rod protein FlgB